MLQSWHAMHAMRQDISLAVMCVLPLLQQLPELSGKKRWLRLYNSLRGSYHTSASSRGAVWHYSPHSPLILR